MNTLNGTLKPIETFYHGFRFRSRLEARWAVYFDKLGVKYQYEPEGFELPSGHYLPDFYLPEIESYVEIKPPGKPKNYYYAPLVYMAGRMEEPCWRPFDICMNCRWDKTMEPLYERFAGRSIIYTGPFRTEITRHSPLHGLNVNGGGEEEVFGKSLYGIKACEVFFALFNDLEAYGTLVEVGMAHALGKKIVVGFVRPDYARNPDRGFSESLGKYAEHVEEYYDHLNIGYGELVQNLWFAGECANKIFSGPTKDGVLQQFGDWLNREYPMPRETILARELHHASNKSVNIFYGDPLEAMQGSGTIYFGEQFIRSSLNHNTAALAARQARFEHGQYGAVP